MRYILISFFLGSLAFAAPTPGDFVEAFNGHFSGTRAAPRARGLHYIFVAGFLSEGIPGYFVDNIRELKKLGARQISVVKPESGKSFLENSLLLQKGLVDILKRDTDRAVIFAHSRGAVDALAFALKNAEYVDKRVEAIFLVQGAFGGGGIADYIRGEGTAPDDRMPQPYRTFFKITGHTEKLLDPCIEKGLTSLTHKNAADFWKGMFAGHADAVPVVHGKTFYIVGKEPPADVTPILKANAWYLQTYYGENDGMVTVEDQSLGKVGTTLALVRADHADLTNVIGLSNSSDKIRRALMRAIVESVN